jgi:hypothetical protein
MKKLRSWWRAGEDGAIVVYRRRLSGMILRMLVALAILAALAPAILRYRNVVLPVVALGVVRGAAEFRRAIMFTGTTLIYRPPFASIRCIPLGGIAGLRKAFVISSFLLRARWTRGVSLTMTNGETILLPLNFGYRSEILERLSAVTAKPIAG